MDGQVPRSVTGEWPTLTTRLLEDALRRATARGAEVQRFAWTCPRSQFVQSSRQLHDAGARLLTLSAIRHEGDELMLTYTFEVGTSSCIVLRTPTQERAVDSLFSSFPAADFLEREVNNIFSVKFLGHPNLPHSTSRRDAD